MQNSVVKVVVKRLDLVEQTNPFNDQIEKSEHIELRAEGHWLDDKGLHYPASLHMSLPVGEKVPAIGDLLQIQIR